MKSAEPAIRQLKERITHKLSPRSAQHHRHPRLPRFRMRQAGYKGPDMFSVGAVREIARASIGLTRRVNIIADKALLAATPSKSTTSRRGMYSRRRKILSSPTSCRASSGASARQLSGCFLLGIGIGMALPLLFKSPLRCAPPVPAPAAAVPVTPALQPTCYGNAFKDIVDT